MTTNANKFGLRKAAAEKSNRHAQRTPLPPRKGVVEAARMAVAASYSDTKSGAKAEAFAELCSQLGWQHEIANRGGATEVLSLIHI